MSRLSSGGLIDRAKPIAFNFDGKRYSGFAGDTLASALVSNDVKLVGRSFKYHRPRGILTAGSEEPNALVTLRKAARAEPNTRATTVELFDGLEATSQNRWPNLSFDVMAVNQALAPFLVAGFYYKTFMWPASFWEKIYEPVIRRAAGLGALSGHPDPDSYDRAHDFCDLLVIGGGPAGLAAALAAGRSGLRVIIANEDWLLGGRLLAERHEIDGAPALMWANEAVAELRSLPSVTLLTRTTVFGAYDDREYAALEQVSDHLRVPLTGQPRQRLWKIVAKRTLIATGAIERPLVFGGNDRPGVMMASAVATYVNRFAAVPGDRAVVFTTSDSGSATTLDLLAGGVKVVAVVDARNEPASPLVAKVRKAEVEVITGAVVSDAYGKTLNAVDVRSATGSIRRIEANLLAVAGGWNPSIAIGSHFGDRAIWSEAIQAFVMATPPPTMIPIGAAAGHFSLRQALTDGIRSAEEIGRDLGRAVLNSAIPQTTEEACELKSLWRVGAHRTMAFVDFQNDVTDADVRVAAQEGFVSIEHLKRYTTLGMATDQGKTSQVNGHALLAAATGKSIAEQGAILSRPPCTPVAIGALAGHCHDEDFRPQRHTSGHQWATEKGATFADVGLWKRARWFARHGDRDELETVNREVIMTRNGVGICDISTLGKIDVHGPDAGALLDLLYINTISTLPVDKARYGVMLREDGFVMDDGTATRFAEDRFYVTATTLNAERVMKHIDYARQVVWPQLDVQAACVTEQWSTFSVAGPHSRALLQKLVPPLDLSNERFPYMAAIELRWQDAPARLFRLSFSGELAYEISVPATHGDRLVRALFEAGGVFDAVPYGTEALGVMRIEKGHPAGNEFNGQTTASDLGMSRSISKKKDFIGRVMANRPGLTDPDRASLVGIRPLDGARLRGGAHLIPRGAQAVADNDQGYVTSAAFSPTLGHWIGLALLKRGSDCIGESVIVHDPLRGADVEAEICNPIFVDPEGIRVRG